LKLKEKELDNFDMRKFCDMQVSDDGKGNKKDDKNTGFISWLFSKE